MGFFAILLLLGVGVARAGVQDELSRVVRYFPPETQGFLYLRAPETLEGLFKDVVPAGGELLEKTAARYLGEFRELTGLRPTGDIEGMVVTLPRPAAVLRGTSDAVVFLFGHYDEGRLIEALEKDPALTTGAVHKEVRRDRPLYVSDGGFAGGFPAEGLIALGPEGLLRSMMEGRSTTRTLSVTEALEPLDLKKHILLASLETEGALEGLEARKIPGTLRHMLRQIEHVQVLATEEVLQLRARFATETDARNIGDLVEGSRNLAQGFLTFSATRYEGLPEKAALARLNPDTILGRFGIDLALKFLGKVVVTREQRLLEVDLPLEYLPLLGRGKAVLQGAGFLAALSMPRLARAREAARIVQCHGLQFEITRALMARTRDTGKVPKELDTELMETLVTEGYLSEMPRDPGAGPDSSSHFHTDSKGFVYCEVHGASPVVPTSPSAPPDP